MTMKKAERIAGMLEYPFAEKLRICSRLKEQGHQVLNLGIGSPDLPPPPESINELQHSSMHLEAHAYQSARGTPELRKTISTWYDQEFQVALNPDTEILPTLGSKESIYMISLAYLNPGDQVLYPDPGYLNYAQAALLAGAELRSYQLCSKNNWKPDFNALEETDLSRVKLMWLNYTHMPTGTPGSVSLMKKALAFGAKHGILICNDNPYGTLHSRNSPSLLQGRPLPPHALELNSLSKSHHMAGWRIGMVLGHSTLIEPVYRLFSHLHSGIFLPIQRAAVTALNVNPRWHQEQRSILGKRREAVTRLLNLLGMEVGKGQQGMFVWAEIAGHISDPEAFADRLLRNHHVFLTPGQFFGPQGNRYIRASLCAPLKDIEEKIEYFENRFQTSEFSV